MQKRLNELKNFFSHISNVKAMMTKEELDDIKEYNSKNKGHRAPPEELIGFCFIINVCQSVEIINKNEDICMTFYPM